MDYVRLLFNVILHVSNRFLFFINKMLHFVVFEKCYLSQIFYSRIQTYRDFFQFWRIFNEDLHSTDKFMTRLSVITHRLIDRISVRYSARPQFWREQLKPTKKFLLKHLTMDFYRRKRKFLIPDNYLNKRKSAKSCCYCFRSLKQESLLAGYFLVAFREINQRVIKQVDFIKVRPCS